MQCLHCVRSKYTSCLLLCKRFTNPENSKENYWRFYLSTLSWFYTSTSCWKFILNAIITKAFLNVSQSVVNLAVFAYDILLATWKRVRKLFRYKQLLQCNTLMDRVSPTKCLILIEKNVAWKCIFACCFLKLYIYFLVFLLHDWYTLCWS